MVNSEKNKGYTLVSHPEWGFLQAEPTPTIDEVRRYYLEEFYSASNSFNDSDLEIQERDKEWYDLCRLRVLENVREVIGSNIQGKVLLDIGCGWGHALEFFRKQGLECYGIEPCEPAVEYCRKRGLNVLLGDLDEAKFHEKSFDIVTLFNVLEHLPDPVLALRKIFEILRPGGILVVDVPNEFNPLQIAGRDLHQTGNWWVAPPAHLNYFNPETLSRLISGLGYVVKIVESSFPLEIFLLFGENYVGNPDIGRKCHEKRMAFEMNLHRLGKGQLLHQIYQSFAKIGIGRQVTVYAAKS